MPSFGHPGLTQTSGVLINNVLVGELFSDIPTGYYFRTILVKLYNYGGSGVCRVCLYDANGNFLYMSDEQTVPADAQLTFQVTQPISSQPAYVMVWSNAQYGGLRTAYTGNGEVVQAAAPYGAAAPTTITPTTAQAACWACIEGTIETDAPEPLPEYALTITAGTGGSTTPAGSVTQQEGTSLNVTATPNTGYTFDHWTLDGATRTENPINITFNADHTLAAFFTEAIIMHQLTVTAGIGGTVSPSGVHTYNEGQQVTVTATPDATHRFDHWEIDGADGGNGGGSGDLLELTVVGDQILNGANARVYFSGVNRPSGFTVSTTGNFFGDGDWVWGSGVLTWNETWVRQRLQQIKDAGLNTVRFVFYVNWWISDSRSVLSPLTGTPNISMRTAMRETTRIMYELGMYAIWVPMGTAGQPSGSRLWSSVSVYTSFMRDLAADLGQYPNAVFDLWSEPWGGYGWAEWAPIAQQAIAAIRTVSNNVIIVDFGSYFDFCTDSRVQGTNIVYSMHIYSMPDGAHLFQTGYRDWVSVTDIRNGLLNTWRCDVPINNGKAVIIGECMCGYPDGTYPDGRSTELSRWANLLSVFNGWGWSYCAWCWDQDQGWQLQYFDTNAPYRLSDYGTRLSNAARSR